MCVTGLHVQVHTEPELLLSFNCLVVFDLFYSFTKIMRVRELYSLT